MSYVMLLFSAPVCMADIDAGVHLCLRRSAADIREPQRLDDDSGEHETYLTLLE